MPDSEWVILAPGTAAERVVPIVGRLFLGRECAGVEPEQRLLVDRPAVSRDHVEIRSHPALGARLLDLSTNGTRLNGRRVERGEPVALADGDRIELGGVELVFRSLAADPIPAEVRTTMRTVGIARVAVVVGDIIGYTAMTEAHGARPVAAATETLFGALRGVLGEHRGTVSNFAGDALFAAWDADRDHAAAAHAVTFALSAADLVAERAATLTIEGADVGALSMGWAVTLGEAASGRPAPGREAIYGDAVNLAFRLSGAAGRDGRAPVLVSVDAAAAAPGAAHYEAIEELPVRGRSARARVHPASWPGRRGGGRPEGSPSDGEPSSGAGPGQSTT